MKASKTLAKLVEFTLVKHISSKISQFFKPKNYKICWEKKIHWAQVIFTYFDLNKLRMQEMVSLLWF
jgi:hypothetical protein